MCALDQYRTNWIRAGACRRFLWKGEVGVSGEASIIEVLGSGRPKATASMADLVVQVYGPSARPDGFAALAGEWNTLLRKSRFNSIFLTHEWQTTWWNHLGQGELWIVAFRTANSGELVGIASLYLVGNSDGSRTLLLVGCVEVSDYLDILVAEGWEEPVFNHLTDWLFSTSAPAWDRIDLCNLPEASLTYTQLARRLEERMGQVEVLQEDVAPQFALPLHYETYLQDQVDKKNRHEIRRKQRRAEREAVVDFYLVGAEHNLEAEIDDFIVLQRASRIDKSEFMTPEMRRFFLAAARKMQEVGWLRLLFLTLNSEKAAALYAFEYDKRFLLYNSGYDPDAHSQLSPGWVLLSYTIQYAIATGCKVFDFMQGNEEYKYRFGSHDYKVMRVRAQRQL